mmetsp:Transcript_16235/g.30914  ORF Transcript_16235/g.30914 Transcript_16235/m.30914 type:complete len:254 (+) Transcript_16235:104-865(+)
MIMTEMNGSHRSAAVTPEENHHHHHHHNGSGTAAPRSSTGSKTRRRRKTFAVSTQWEQEVAENRAPRDFHRYFCCCARRIGHMFALMSYPDGTPIIIAGPCWPFCVFVTLPMILGVAGLVGYFVIYDDNRFNLPDYFIWIYGSIVAFVLLSLFCVSCRDPGLMDRVVDEEAGEGGWFWNEQVGSFRPPGALYCRECGVLIQEYDHLCPWTGTGIGRGNMCAFKTFVVSINVLCYCSIGLVVWGLLDGLAAGER